ncbi:ATP-binding protein [Parasphingorhabdus sp.]|uniref:AAA family ATPase n=1 Tax=Parasphingorhabdus sp. TaxID=2709688 RepID=UPI002F949844
MSKTHNTPETLPGNLDEAFRPVIAYGETAEEQEDIYFQRCWAKIVQRQDNWKLRTKTKSLIKLLNDETSFEFSSQEIEEVEDASISREQRITRTREISLQILEKYPHPPFTQIDRQIGWLCDLLKLGVTERKCLSVLARSNKHGWRVLTQTLSPERIYCMNSYMLSQITGLAHSDVERSVGFGSPLIERGLIRVDSEGDITVGDFLISASQMVISSAAEMVERLLQIAPASTLDEQAYDHMREQTGIVGNLISKGGPTAILLYGPPGTGKTEFARHLADQTGKPAVFAGLADEHGREPSRDERLAHFSLLNEIAHTEKKHLVILDEADDVLSSPGIFSRASWSKQWVNRLVEQVKGPTIFILNHVEAIPESVCRRMHYAMRFDPPNEAVRRRMVLAHAKTNGLKLDESAVVKLAKLPARPSMLGSAIASAANRGSGPEMAEIIARSLVEATSGQILAPVHLPSAYDPSLSNANVPLDQLVQRFRARQDAPARDLGWSLLLAGPSGTGKSAFAHHLAQKINIDVIEKRGSDLLKPYLGQTEAAIAEAFAEARRAGAMLLIDEADDFLTDRRDATRSWERTMVTEMLRWMEHLEAPFVATTNLADKLDPATQRRFTMRVDFSALAPEQSAALFLRYFKQPLPERHYLTGQTPGDFAVVARRAELLGENNADRLLDWLRAEAELRGDSRVPIGF